MALLFYTFFKCMWITRLYDAFWRTVPKQSYHLSGVPTGLFKSMLFEAEGRQHWYQTLFFFHSSMRRLSNLKKSGQGTVDLQIAMWLDTSMCVKDLSGKTDIQPICDFICKFLNFILWCLYRFRVFHFKNKTNKNKERLDLPFVHSSWVL